MTYEVNTRSGVKVLARGEDIHYLGKRNQCREGRNRTGAIYHRWIDSKEDMTMSKHPSHQEKVETQEKEAKERVVLGFEISACQI